MKAVIYTRVSTQSQAQEGVSLEHQLEKCRLQANLLDYEVIEEITDAGESAKDLHRPGVQKVIALAKSKKIDAVLILKLDRLSRSVGDINYLVQLFNKVDVALISVKDSLDTKSASGRLVVNILSVLSQFEREQIAERTAEAMNFKKSENRKFTSLSPYGFRLEGDVYVEVPTEQSTVSEIVRLKDDAGMSYQFICDYLNQAGIPTRKGGKWQKMVVQQIYTSVKQGRRMVSKA